MEQKPRKVHKMCPTYNVPLNSNQEANEEHDEEHDEEEEESEGHLRNKADGISYGHHQLLKFGDANCNSISSSKSLTTAKEATKRVISKSLKNASYVQLPNDSKTLTEMYFESIHYNIPELTDRICSQQTLARIFGVFGSNNPFQMATTALAMGKRMVMSVGVLLTSMGGWAYAQAMTAQEKTTKYLEEKDYNYLPNQSEFWVKQAEYWKIIADKFNGALDEK